MKDIISKNHIKDGVLIESDEILGFDDKSKTVIYEVIRVINRVGVFKEDHLARLDKSLTAAGIDKPEYLNDIDSHIKTLGETNSTYNYTIKLMITMDSDKKSHYCIYIMDCFYPGKDMIEVGIHTDFMEWERINPNTKIVNSGYKETAAMLMKKYNAFELLLVNSEGYITEGSRTNVFFVKGDKLITAPSEYILKGITRKYVLSACERVGLKVTEQLLKKEQLPSIDGAFVCGTSLKVLPIESCGNIKIPSSENQLVKLVVDEYDKIMNEYINNYIKG
jgi:Branched-chain amino acid aminotransferase/4-amino-4-deoxychorismate lyase